jgi:ABC-type branched-subunit amino acid transport system substrate-binding protein
VVTLLLAACSNSSDTKPTAAASGGSSSGAASNGDTTTHVALSGVPGVSDTEIDFSSLGTNSNNPLGTCVLDCFDDGIKAYFDFRNSQGGIYGRKLVLSKSVDDELSNNQAKALEIVSANDTFGTFSAAQIGSGWADLASAGIPTYVWAINPAQATGHPEIYGNREVDCISCTTRPSTYAISAAGGKRIATLGYGVSENSKECADSTAQSVEKYSSNIGGAHAVYTNDNLDFGLPNGIGPEVTAMKQANVDVIFACIDLNGVKTLAQEMQRQGIRQSVKIVHTNTYDQKFVQDAGNLFAGDIVAVSFRPFEADPGQSQLKDFHEWMAKDGKTETEMAMNGWINADLAYQGLKAAGPNFDRSKVVNGSNTQLTSFTAGGLTQPVDWSRQHEAPTEEDPATHGAKLDCQALVKVGPDGKFQMVGDPTKPWMCFPGNTRDWSDPVAMDFN